MYCIHHNDLDGVCSAAIVCLKYKGTETIEFVYDKPFDVDDLSGKVILVDISYNAEFMRSILEKTDEIVWIDHHKTSTNRLRHIPGIRDTSKSASSLCWEYFFPGTAVPEAVGLTDDWDTYRHEHFPRCLHFRYGIESITSDPKSDIWQTLVGNGDPRIIPSLCADGHSINRYLDKLSAAQNNLYGKTAEWDGLSCFFINREPESNSIVDRLLDHDIAVCYIHNGDRWKVSMYSAAVDVSVLAVKHGGGGHANASGFSCDNLPWL